MRRIWKKVVLSVGGTLAAATLAIGALHMPFAKPLLMRLGGCPMSIASPHDAEKARNAALNDIRGSVAAPARPALGFLLDQTTTDEVLAWSKERKLDCDDGRDHTLVVCKNVPAATFGEAGKPIAQVAFLFRESDRKLLNVTTMRVGLNSDEASALLTDVTDRMQRDLGKPSQGGGDKSATGLSEPSRSFLAEYRFKDYVADTSALNLGPQGIMVREHYIAVD